MIDKELLKILACPRCKGELILRDDKLVCLKCKKYYPIKEGIPIMLVEEAKDLNEEESQDI
ncbi:MAG: Trm112 family protein [Candidatus Aerophobetes bacterium]|nr:Trm112 family protein [Candidatus Aerophobetes bacterium]